MKLSKTWSLVAAAGASAALMIGAVPAHATESADATDRTVEVASGEVWHLGFVVNAQPWNGSWTYTAECPTSHPYLKRFKGPGSVEVNDPMEGKRITPGGVRVDERGGVAVSTYEKADAFEKRNDAKGIPHYAYKGVVGDYANWNISPVRTEVWLNCVSDFWNGAALRDRDNTIPT